MAYKKNEQQQTEGKVRLPTGTELFGIVTRRLGGSRMDVKCEDGKSRNCRIPGAMKRSLWVREEDLVIVQPWKIGGEERGDIVFKYKPFQAQTLEKKGFLKVFEQMEEF